MSDTSEYIAEQQAALTKRTRVAGDWFIFYAAAGLISSILFYVGLRQTLYLFGSVFLLNVRVGLLLTQNFGIITSILALLLNIGFAFVCYVLAKCAKSRHAWAFGVGSAIAFFDLITAALSYSALSFFFDLFLLYMLFTGFSACSDLARIRQALLQQSYQAASAPRDDIWPPPPAVGS